MSTPADPYSILNKDPDRGVFKPKFDPTKKVERLRPGVMPKWAEDQSEDIEVASKPVNIKQISISSISNKPGFAHSESAQSKGPEADIVSAYTTHTDSDAELESEEYESDEQEISSVLLKPSFVDKDNRVTLLEKAQKEQEERELEEQLKLMQQEVRIEANKRILEEMKLEEFTDRQQEENLEDEDDLDDPEEIKKWKIREIKRILRDKEEREARQKELEEIERRRNLTDWERREEDKLLGNDESAKPQKRKIKFLQKYYHKGIFFQQRDEHGKLHPLFMRDYNAPVEEDTDKAILPGTLQKRRGDFGKKGQSKWTHLTAEDTTNFDPLFRVNESLSTKQQMKQGGYKSMNYFGKNK
jgi:microfibrillar-associated protein 1